MAVRRPSDAAIPRSQRHDYWGVVLNAPDAAELAQFYSALLGWPIVDRSPTWVTVAPDEGVAYLAFQTSPCHEPPIWPDEPGRQQMQLHLDFEVEDLDEACREAVALGATPADHQPQDDVRVLLDPAGHPFCLYRGT